MNEETDTSHNFVCPARSRLDRPQRELRKILGMPRHLINCAVFFDETIIEIIFNGVTLSDGRTRRGNMSSYIGLYYPFIGFMDDSWIKLAALYWDKLGRIVPNSYIVQDSDTVQELTDELGFVINFMASEKDKAIIGEIFLSILSQHQKKFNKLFHLDSKFDFAKTSQTVILKAGEERRFSGNGHWIPEYMNLDTPNPQLTYLLEEKVFRPLGEALIDAGLALKLNSGKLPTMIGMHPKVALIYMKLLAERMAAQWRFHPLTDNIFDHVVSGYSIEQLTQMLLPESVDSEFQVASTLANDVIETQIATIALQSILPRNIADVPTKKIVRLRKKHQNELTAFQTYIHDLVANLENFQNFDDPAALKAHLEVEYEKTLKSLLNDLRKCLNELGIDTVMGAMNVRAAIPALLVSAGSFLHIAPINPMIIGAGAIAFSVLPVIKKKQNEAKQWILSSPASYLLYAQEGLEPANLISQVTQKARQSLYRI